MARLKLEDLRPDMRVAGVVPGGLVTVGAAQSYGPDAVRLTYTDPQGSLAQRVLFRSDEAALAHVHAAGAPFDADPEKFKLAAEAQRIQLAGLYDPMLAVATSNIEPLPHQIRAVYGELLPRTPLRFLVADDPGAGKTIMAGLYIKELLLRDDVKRCLVVAPGGLVEQWQDELFLKFGLSFDILTREAVTAAMHTSVFEKYPLLIARMDQLSRNEDLRAQLEQSEWDLVIVDEAHRMAAHWWGGELSRTKRFELGELLRDRTRHLLLMTATPHSGSEENFQAFLTLLDRDEFAGRYRKALGRTDTSQYMRRMIKEDLLTFEGKNEPDAGGGADNAPRPSKTRFFGSRTLSSGREAADFKLIFDEILPHLRTGNLTVRVEIEADSLNGYPEAAVRTVSENAATLKFDQHGFED